MTAMKPAKSVKIGAGLAATMLLLAGCASANGGEGPAPEQGGAEVTESIVIATYPGLYLDLPNYVALAEGFFEKHNLDAELIDIAGGPNQATAVATGDVDVFSFTINSVASLRAKGQNYSAIAANQPLSSNVIVGSNSAIDKCATANDPFPGPIKCLKGHTVGVPQLGGDLFWMMTSLLGEASLTIDDVTLIAVGGSSNLPSAFQSEQVDFAIGVDPGPAMLSAMGLTRPLVDLSVPGAAGDTFSPWAGQTYFALDSALAEGPSKYTKFQAAIADAMAWIADTNNAAALAKIIEDNLGVPSDVAESLAKSKNAIFSDKFDCVGVEKVIDWAISVEQLEQQDRISCDEIIWSGAAHLVTG